MPYAKGHDKGGRPKGVKNKVTRDAAAFCLALVTNPAYVKRFTAAFLAGELPPATEQMVWFFAYGKPKEQVEHSGEVHIPRVIIHDLR